MNKKISIIIPIFNVGSRLKEGLNSIINQTIGTENLEIIMVDDCSTDNSGEIIDEYAQKYEFCVAVHLEENSGSANKPRNIGIKKATGEYVMFLDSDDQFVEDACETLYDAITEYDSEVAIARFRRIFNEGRVQKSYSPYHDNLYENYPDEIFETANHLNVPDILWDSFLEKFLYGKDLEVTYKRDKPLDIIHVDNVEDEPDLIKIPPAVWNKIYKRELLIENGIEFKPFIAGEDLAFTLEVFLNAKGIVFLNNYICYNYYVRNDKEDKSISNVITAKFLEDLIDSFIYCAEISEGFSDNVKNVTINPQLLYWTNTWKNSPCTKQENRTLLRKLNKLKEIHKTDLKTKMLLGSITTALESKIQLQKE